MPAAARPPKRDVQGSYVPPRLHELHQRLFPFCYSDVYTPVQVDTLLSCLCCAPWTAHMSAHRSERGNRCHERATSGCCKDGVPTGIRTPVTAVKGRCPRPLDDGDCGGCVQSVGGGNRDRTGDLLHAMQALSQ